MTKKIVGVPESRTCSANCTDARSITEWKIRIERLNDLKEFELRFDSQIDPGDAVVWFERFLDGIDIRQW